MNQHKKRKFPGTSHSVPDQKKTKLDSIKNENLKANKKIQHKGSTDSVKPQKEGKTNKTVTSVQTSDKQPSLKKKKKQWQSVKEKRKRLKKKYLNVNNTGDKSTLTESDKTTHAIPPEKKVKLPQTSSEYSSNWKNLMKVYLYVFGVDREKPPLWCLQLYRIGLFLFLFILRIWVMMSDL